MVKFIVVRHGHSLSNKEGTYTGQLDIGLSDEGFAQADALAEYLSSKYTIDFVYASDLCRAFDTADKLAKKINKKVIVEKDFKEMYCGAWQGLTAEQAQKLFPEDFLDWQTNELDGRCTDGEWMSEVKARALNALLKLAKAHDGKTVVIVTHGCVIRNLQSEWLGITYKELKSLPWVTNASVTVVDYDNGLWDVKETGYDGFLGNMRTAMPKVI